MLTPSVPTRLSSVRLPRFNIGTDMYDFGRVADDGVGCFAISLILLLVLGPDIAAFGLESTVAVDADKRARASDFGGIVDDGPIFEIVEFGQIGRAHV